LHRIVDVLIVGLVGVAVAAVWLGHRRADWPPAVDLTGPVPATPSSVATAARPPPHPGTGPPQPTAMSGRSAPLPRSAPVDLRIPAIGVQARLMPLGLTADGGLQVPTDFALAGWYRLGPTPGEAGPVVIAGHVDSYQGPAVFFRLSRLRPGDWVRVARQDGLVTVFRVYGVGQYSKTAFPTDRVYANTESPELRLITCGGAFDTHVRSYSDNIVVYARLVSTEPG
jgi:sortase (surface protein transpeptidase)